MRNAQVLVDDHAVVVSQDVAPVAQPLFSRAQSDVLEQTFQEMIRLAAFHDGAERVRRESKAIIDALRKSRGAT